MSLSAFDLFCYLLTGGACSEVILPMPDSDLPSQPEHAVTLRGFTAAVRGDCLELKNALDEGFDLESRSARGRTPLMLACLFGNTRFVEAILQAGASVSAAVPTTSRMHLVSPPSPEVEEPTDFERAVGDFLDLDSRAPVIDFADGAVEALDAIERCEELVESSCAFQDPPDPSFCRIMPSLRSVLDFAVVGGSDSLVRLVLAAGAEPDFMPEGAETSALQLAVLSGDAYVVALLLAYGASVDLAVGTTPLVLACARGRNALVTQFLDMGAEVDARDEEGLTPTLAVASGGFLRSLQMLIEKGASLDPVEGGPDPILVAAHKGHRELVEHMADTVCSERSDRAVEILEGRENRQSEPDENGEALVAAAQYNEREEVERLLEAEVPVDYVSETGYSALMVATNNGFFELVDHLLEWKADPNLPSSVEPCLTPLMMAASSVFVEDRSRLLSRLMYAGADPDARDSGGRTALMHTMTRGEGCLDALEDLIQFGADIEARDLDGNSALMHAIQGGHKDSAKILRNSEDVSDGLEEIALLEASAQGNHQAVSDLILAGADVDYRCGWTPLMAAASAGSLEVVELLLDAGAQIDRGASDLEHRDLNPLLVAAQNGYFEVVVRLIEAGADVSVRAGTLGSALDFALVGQKDGRYPDRNWQELVEFLQEKSTESPSTAVA